MAAEVPILVPNVEYRLVPEHHFPVGSRTATSGKMGRPPQCTCWAAQSQLSIDLSLAIVLGGSKNGPLRVVWLAMSRLGHGEAAAQTLGPL